MSISIGSNNSNVTRIHLKKADGTSAGTITITKPSKKKPKKLNYNFKEISALLLATKTSGGARQVAIKARGKTAMLQGKLSNSSEYDSRELRIALVHAQKMERIARKRVKHMQQEEEAKRKGSSSTVINEEEMLEMESIENTDSGDMEEELELSREEIEEMLREMEELMAETMEELQEETGLDELAEELMAVSSDMDPEDLEQLRKKHRSDELREIVEADMKYLKALIDKLLEDKQEAANGVALELGGMEMPVEVMEAPIPTSGGNVDITV